MTPIKSRLICDRFDIYEQYFNIFYIFAIVRFPLLETVFKVNNKTCILSLGYISNHVGHRGWQVGLLGIFYTLNTLIWSCSYREDFCKGYRRRTTDSKL